MRKRIVDVFILLAYMGVLGSLCVSMRISMPKQTKCETEANTSLTESSQVFVKSNKVDLSNEEFCDALETLAKCVEAEAGNQDLYGKRLVVDVILNRVDSKRFPDNIEDVISQKYQFSTYWNGSMDRIEPSEQTFEAVRMELEERTDENILFFTAGNYNTYCVPAYKYKDHYFGY